MNTSGMAAASSMATLEGTAIAWRSLTTTRSAYAPPDTRPITASPSVHCTTRDPSPDTRPENSRPGTSCVAGGPG